MLRRRAYALNNSHPIPERRRRIAWWISVVAHPFVLVPAGILVVSVGRVGAARAFGFVVAVLLMTIVPMAFYIRRRLRKGRFSDYDVSRQKDRPELFTFGLGLMALAAAVFWWTPGLRFLFPGTVAVTAMIVAAALINLWDKVSLHSAFAAYVVVFVAMTSPGLSIAGAVVALAVGWSRVELGRHTRRQVALGLVLGTITGLGLLLALKR